MAQVIGGTTGVTVTVTGQEMVVAPAVADNVYVVVVRGETTDEPLRLVEVTPLLILKLVIPLVDHVSVLEPPVETVAGLAVKVTLLAQVITTGGKQSTVTLVVQLDLPSADKATKV